MDERYEFLFCKSLGQLVLAVATLTTTFASFAQGTIDFSNIKVSGRPRVYLEETLTLPRQPIYIEGSNFLIDILVKNPATGNWDGVLKNGAPFTGVSPLTGSNAGLFSGGTLVVPFVAPGATADVKVRAWDARGGSSFETSVLSGSVAFSIDGLGGAGAPPTLPAIMGNFTWSIVPEPSTYAFGSLGLGLVVLHSLRTNRRKG